MEGDIQTATLEAAPRRTLRAARVAFTARLAGMTQAEARDVVRRAGGRTVEAVSRRTTILVVGMDGWPLLRDGSISAKLRRAEELNAAGGRIRIISEDVFLEMAGLRPRQQAGGKRHTAEEICRLVGIDGRTLARWEQLGLVRSDDGRFDFQDIVSLRTIAELVARGVRPDVIGRSLRGLSAILPGTDRPLAQLALVAGDDGRLLAEAGENLVASDGQFLLNFGADDAPLAPADLKLAGDGGPVTATSASAGGEPVDASGWFERGRELEDHERYAEAAEAYDRCLAAQPSWPEAHFNRGNALRALGRSDDAIGAYRRAVEQDPRMAWAWYNMADVQEERGRFRDAIESLEAALRADPIYADAHFNLAFCYEKLGRNEEAERHWRRYAQLDPHSEWAEIARQRLSQSR